MVCCFRTWWTCHNQWSHKFLPQNPEGEHSPISLWPRAQAQSDLQQDNQASPPLIGLKEIKWRFWGWLVKVLTWILLKHCDKNVNRQAMHVIHHEKKTTTKEKLFHSTLQLLQWCSNLTRKFRNPLPCQFKYMQSIISDCKKQVSDFTTQGWYVRTGFTPCFSLCLVYYGEYSRDCCISV